MWTAGDRPKVSPRSSCPLQARDTSRHRLKHEKHQIHLPAFPGRPDSPLARRRHPGARALNLLRLPLRLHPVQWRYCHRRDESGDVSGDASEVAGAALEGAGQDVPVAQVVGDYGTGGGGVALVVGAGYQVDGWLGLA